jgi:RNA polymerase sigma factor (sigma-70 family)
MSNEMGDVERLLERVRAGAPEAAEQIVKIYGPLIRVVIRRHLDHRVRRIEDSEDIEQEVFFSFFRDARKKYHFERAEDLKAFLLGLAHHLTVNANRRHLNCAKRAGDRHKAEQISPGYNEPVSPQPGPFELAVADDEWKHLAEDLSQRQRMIMTMRLDGFSEQEIACEVGLNGRTIRKELQVLGRDFRGGGGETSQFHPAIWSELGDEVNGHWGDPFSPSCRRLIAA